jgi:creatinine amidohydrolase/Fe(II)-dependent formamide hydrolase-like protein
MGVPISIRLDDDVRAELESQARERGIGLATLPRDVATRAARDAQRARIRQASEAIGHRVASDPEARAFYPEARAFYDEIGSPTTDAG